MGTKVENHRKRFFDPMQTNKQANAFIFFHNTLLTVEGINIHLLSKFSSEIISYYMNQSPIQYFSLTQSEAKLFQYINQFHSNGYLADRKQLDYSRLDSAYITPFIPFLHFYQFILSNSKFIKNNTLRFSSKYKKPIIGNEILLKLGHFCLLQQTKK
jgi:hypothetical protein